ncbi:MAG: patatin-like phospholipase family protein [Halieaceae bacterium]
MLESLSVYAGDSARALLAREGWRPQLFDTLVGASGGPKLLGIAGLDQFLFGDFLQRSHHPMHLIGSSIGTWRHAALAAADPVASLAKLHHQYINQHYDEAVKPTSSVIGEVCEWILDGYADAGLYDHLCEHPRFQTHIVTARGLGPNSARHPLPRALGMGLAALGNALHRQLLQPWFQRVVFSSHGRADLGFPFEDFDTVHVPLQANNARRALLASGSIPFVMPGERDIAGAPAGHYWDGGIVDYHFDFKDYRGNGLVLYPHFRDDITPGWFDKSLPWRRAPGHLLDQVVLLCPAPAFLASLPLGKIPDRRDFPKMTQAERINYWQSAASASQVLGDEFAALVDGPDPLAGVQAF